MVRRYGTRENIHKLRLSFLKGRRDSVLFFFSLWDVTAQGGRRRGGAERSPIPFFFFSSRHSPKLLILQRASARANADRTFSDQQLGRATGKEENKNVGLGEHRMLATVVLVFLTVCAPLRRAEEQRCSLCSETVPIKSAGDLQSLLVPHDLVHGLRYSWIKPPKQKVQHGEGRKG